MAIYAWPFMWSLKIYLYGGCPWQPMRGHQVVIENIFVYWVPSATYAWASVVPDGGTRGSYMMVVLLYKRLGDDLGQFD